MATAQAAEQDREGRAEGRSTGTYHQASSPPSVSSLQRRPRCPQAQLCTLSRVTPLLRRGSHLG